jgi:predicted transcriptional regulator
MIMAGRRTTYEIYWEILVFCKTPRTFTAIICRCDLNSKTGQEHLGFLIDRGYLIPDKDGKRSRYISSERSDEYLALFSRLYQGLYDTIPGFRL